MPIPTPNMGRICILVIPDPEKCFLLYLQQVTCLQVLIKITAPKKCVPNTTFSLPILLKH